VHSGDGLFKEVGKGGLTIIPGRNGETIEISSGQGTDNILRVRRVRAPRGVWGLVASQGEWSRKIGNILLAPRITHGRDQVVVLSQGVKKEDQRGHILVVSPLSIALPGDNMSTREVERMVSKPIMILQDVQLQLSAISRLGLSEGFRVGGHRVDRGFPIIESSLGNILQGVGDQGVSHTVICARCPPCQSRG
jgi:hypothetical protein